MFSYLMRPSKLIMFSLKFIAMEPTGKSLISTDRKISDKTAVSSAYVKPNGSSISTDCKISEKTVVSSASVKPNGSSISTDRKGSSGDTAGDKARKATEILEADEEKRPKSG